MRLKCIHCGSTMTVKDSNRLGIGIKDAYAQCTNQECEARSVFRISHEHDLKAPKKNLLQSIETSLASLDDETREWLMKKYCAPRQPQLF